VLALVKEDGTIDKGIKGVGDGIGGSETELNDFPSSLDECAILVKEQFPNANGATWDGPDDNGLGHCYAEFGQTSRNDLSGYTNVQFFSGTTLGTAPDVTTVIEDVNYFIIAPGQTVNVLGTLIVKAKRTQIDGTLNGNGGGYAGAVASTTDYGANALPGESPPDTNGHGRGGLRSTSGTSGGGGGSHGKLLFSLSLLLSYCC